MRAIVVGVLLVAFSGSSSAEDKEPFAARISNFIFPKPHTHERAGTAKPYSHLAASGVSSHESGGYVGGGKLVRGEGRGETEGVFGWDYTFFGRRPGRIFLGWHNDSTKHQSPILPRYAAEGPRVTDVLALQPFKKAVREAKEEKRHGGKEE